MPESDLKKDMSHTHTATVFTELSCVCHFVVVLLFPARFL